MKNHFNDYKENGVAWHIECPDCRCCITLKINHYPHGPNIPLSCPVCKQDDIKVKVAHSTLVDVN